jgi:hypothetical protein
MRDLLSLARKLGLLSSILLGGCQYFGPNSIDVGRADYNSAIQHTSAQQVLANIIRVHHHEMPLVMDVTQVNAALIVQGTATSSVSGIGSLLGLSGAGPVVPTSPSAGALSTRVVSNQVESVGGTVEYEENPTITYTPLSGQPLIAQLSTPITVDSLAALPDHGWDIAGLMALSVSYLTPNYADEGLAENAISELNWYGAIATSSGRSTLSGAASPGKVGPSNAGPNSASSGNGGQGGSPPANDTLIIYLAPYHAEAFSYLTPREKIMRLWIRLLKIYWDVQPSKATEKYGCGKEFAKTLDGILTDLNGFDHENPLPDGT